MQRHIDRMEGLSDEESPENPVTAAWARLESRLRDDERSQHPTPSSPAHQQERDRERGL